MKVIISGQVLSAISGTEDVWKLHQLLAHACSGRHVVGFDPPNSLNIWLDQLDPASKATYSRAVELSTRKVITFPADAASVRVELIENSQWNDPYAVLNIDEALGVLNEPLGILLENSEND